LHGTKIGGDASYWAEIGAAWANKDGKGFNPKPNLMPVGEADIVVREVQAGRRCRMMLLAAPAQQAPELMRPTRAEFQKGAGRARLRR
jgi:hypothetical protein